MKKKMGSVHPYLYEVHRRLVWLKGQQGVLMFEETRIERKIGELLGFLSDHEGLVGKEKGDLVRLRNQIADLLKGREALFDRILREEGSLSNLWISVVDEIKRKGLSPPVLVKTEEEAKRLRENQGIEEDARVLRDSLEAKKRRLVR